MNKFLYFILISCITVIANGCSKDFEEGNPPGPGVISNSVISTYRPHVSANGDTIEIKWRQGVEFGFNFYTAEWEYGHKESNIRWDYSIKEISPVLEVETITENDTIKGDWFTVRPTGSISRYDGRYSGIRLIVLPNTSGKRRYLKISPKGFAADEYVFQECEEQMPRNGIVLRYYSVSEFDSLFVGTTWRQSAIYDVDSGGRLGKNLFDEVDGMAAVTLEPLTATMLRYHCVSEDPAASETVVEESYSFQQGNVLTFDRSNDQMPQELKVLEINDSEMRCLGDVFNQQWTPDAVKGLYVFKKVK
jgi:hypothetical protein